MNLNTLKKKLDSYHSYRIFYHKEVLLEKEGQHTNKTELLFEETNLGEFFYSGESLFGPDHLSCLFKTASHTSLDYTFKLLDWLEQIYLIQPHLFNWIGIYFKESFLEKSQSENLVIGPYLGEPTDHKRISLSKGICGMALREQRVINVRDVHEVPEHIACSLSTKSELVIPIKDMSGEFIAELDIDSNTIAAFTPELEEQVKKACLNFPHY